MDLAMIWAAIIAFGVIMYVILDGFDLGIGILFWCIKDEHHRSIMMDTVAPIWDGNETWLVLGAALLYGAFPPAYSTLLPALYLPIMLMLAALIFRGLAFEFRPKAQRSRFVWDIAFTSGSTLAGFMQGMILGAFVEGKVFAPEATGILSDWCTPFSVMAGFGVVVGYALLGATWLIAKTHAELQERMFALAKVVLWMMTFFIALVSIWTPLINPHVRELWFSLPKLFYLSPLPILTGVAILAAGYALKKKQEFIPFYLSISLFIFAYIGFCISSWPYIVPHQLTIWQAQAPHSSQIFMLVGVIILLPVLLTYTAYSYRVFGGKVLKGGEHYDHH